jgi:shikimate kinase
VNLRLKRTPGIYLVGFMGSGKSTIGKLLASRLGWRFIDLDEEIETAEGLAIAEIFERRGEREFRRIEHERLLRHVREIECGRPAVVALGGGAFIEPANFELCVNNGVTVWLDVPLETARRRVAGNSGRPLARNRAHFEALYENRRPLYARADYRVAIKSDEPGLAVQAILDLPLWNVR